MKSKHRIDPTDDNGIIVRNNAENMKDTLQFMLVLTVIVGVIGGGTLIAGIIGISNIMVYIIKERTKEIGVRKAIGARPNSIVALILQESVVITVISGLVGVLFGLLTLNLLGNSLEPYFIKRTQSRYRNGNFRLLMPCNCRCHCRICSGLPCLQDKTN